MGHPPSTTLGSSRSPLRRGLNWRTFAKASTCCLLTLTLDFCQSAKSHSRQTDETLRIGLLIAARFLKARDFRVVQWLRRFTPHDGRVAFEQLEPCEAFDIALRVVNERLQRFPLRREPIAVVHHFGVARN